MGATLKYALLVVIGLLLGLFAYQGFDRASENAKHRETVQYLTEALARAQAMECDTIYDTTWRTEVIYSYIPNPIPHEYAVTDSLPPCILHWYQDTIPFEEFDLAYSLSTIGTLEDMSFGYKLKVPKIINVPVPCPEAPPVCPPPVPSKWSATVMVGYPSAAYVGVGYRIAPKIDVTGGVHTLLIDPARGSAMVGLRIGL